LLSGIRFIGNVPIGAEGEVSVDTLRKYYDAIVFAYGASRTRKLGIPGEDLDGVYPAGDFVGWYNGLPSHRDRKFNLDGENAIIIGHGNVALDVARILLTPTDTLAKTDITEYALEELKKSKVKNVTIVGRRGVLQASFTVKELRELTNIPNVKFETDIPSNLPDPKSLPRVQQRILQLLKKAPFVPSNIEKICRIEFLLNPTQFLGATHVTAADFERQQLLDPLDPKSKIHGTKQYTQLNADLIFTSIGYTAEPLKGMSAINVDLIRGIIPNNHGRVITTATKDFGYVDNEAAMKERLPGIYCSGWVKTGPTGVIATTMLSAFETGDSLVEDWNEGREFLEPESKQRGWEGFREEIGAAKAVEWPGWKLIESEENRRGVKVGKQREKIVDIQEMLDIIN
jgi:adrenodoxin-NADP+ reductase